MDPVRLQENGQRKHQSGHFLTSQKVNSAAGFVKSCKNESAKLFRGLHLEGKDYLLELRYKTIFFLGDRCPCAATFESWEDNIPAMAVAMTIPFQVLTEQQQE